MKKKSKIPKLNSKVMVICVDYMYRCKEIRQECEFTKEGISLFDIFIKRVFDISLSILALLIAFPPLFIAIVIINTFSSNHRYPVFFKQKRTGLHGKTFVCYKFRSMKVNRYSDSKQAMINDPRVTKFGSFLRKYSLDEVPQFLNVLIGNMSVVGPRPHMLRHTVKYSSLIPNYMKRHSVKPGITGYAQITGHRGETKELSQMEGRVKKDLWYIENQSLWLDIKIVALTPKGIRTHI